MTFVTDSVVLVGIVGNKNLLARMLQERSGKAASSMAKYAHEIAPKFMLALVLTFLFPVLFSALVYGTESKFKYMLQCGAAKSVPPDDDADRVFVTRILAVRTGEIYVRHFAASGARYDRSDQYRDLRFWSDEKAEYWSGTSVKHPDRAMVGQIRLAKTGQWVEYIEKHYRGGKLESTTTSVCQMLLPEQEKDGKPS